MQHLVIKKYAVQVGEQPNRWINLRRRRAYRSLPYEDQYIKKTRDIWLLGPPQCGKTSAMRQLIDKSAEVWRRWPILHCQATDPIGRWSTQDAVVQHLQAQGVVKRLSAEERIDALLSWAGQCQWVLLIDDAHALSGRKLDLIVQLAQKARLVVMGALSEQALHPSLRTCLQRRGPQVLNFRSETPYDATVTLVCLLFLMALAAGWYELAAALTTARALGHGPLASRQR